MWRWWWVPIVAAFIGCGGASLRRPLPTVPQVDLTRFQGDWFVIAHIPYWLEAGKVATYDRYRLRPDGTMDNEYWFRRGSFTAPEEVWRGSAWVHNTTTNAEWRVQFVWPLQVPYLIIGLDPAYRWALIGHPSRDYLWVLARENILDEITYRLILHQAYELGYDVTRVHLVPQVAP